MSSPHPPGGPPLRALAMILIALAIVFGGLGALSLSRSDSAAPAATVTPSVAPGTASANIPGASARPSTSTQVPVTSTPASVSGSSSAGVDKSVSVRVLNNSTVTGLAAKTAATLQADGFTVAETGNYSSGDIPKTTVYYGSSAAEKQVAQAVAEQLGVAAEPRFPGISNASPGVIVIVTG